MGIYHLTEKLVDTVLAQKVRFPLLEFSAKQLYSAIPYHQHILLLDSIIAHKTIGGNVIAGIILQLRLKVDFSASLNKAVEYIIAGDEWYVCDIIGERVMGYALLTMPEKTIPFLKKCTKHANKWIVRCVGVATHYAVKKGLKKAYVEEMFRLLLSLSHLTEFHTVKGVGWAAKTIAKFHPDIISRYEMQINSETTRQWFHTKIKIGLGRTAKYAHRYTD